ncbi:hypothetical protein SKAU_G00297960 [Synaphobranchus kaupii]|uniref:Ig-like domain-containing protein n=1 Tax=Synaphobranchus kaupii TaxID=118154 RepID=A0A9Q1EV41_SYNKA|nr:hypothetical protein SKAU_G00297960 [Synaphobranchus kaupii]
MCGGALIRVLLGLLCVGVRVGSEGHSIQFHPASVVVRHGDPVLVNCTVTGDHIGIGWEASEGSVGTVTDVQFVTWRLDHVTEWDIRPRCYMNYLIGKNYSQQDEKLRITLYLLPESLDISAVNHTGPMLEGQQYRLQCEATNIAPVQNLTVKWYKGETLENQTSYDDLSKTPVDVSSTLLITPTSADDGAQYSCVAELELGPEGPQPPPSIKSDPLTITVHYKPRITGCSDHMELREGETLDTLVSCRAKGNPSPMVTWYRDQSELNSSTPLTRRDVGRYVITAKSALGSASVNLTLGYGPIFICDHKYEVRVNERHALMCTAEGFPLPEVTWFTEEENEEVELPAHMTRGDAGQYRLIARNAFGAANHTLEIEVLYPPSEIELEGDEVDFGASVVLKCSAWGNPRPTYSWVYQRSPDVQERSVDGVSLLNISRASERNNGSYSCYAENPMGNVSKTVRLTVTGEDKSLHTTISECPIKIEPSTVVVRHGDPVSVNCTVSADHVGIGWEASEGSVDMVTDVQFVTWNLETVTDWEMAPRCFANFPTKAGPPFQCDEKINITLYKPPDSVSISAVNHTGPMVEREEYQLQCEVQNIAPVQYLTVKWYKGGTLENQTSYDDLTKTPVNVSSTLLITPTSADDGAQYSCVAELELGPEGPQPPPSIKSDPLNITVHYPPFFYSPKDETLELTEGEGVPLNCSAQGNPPPEYSWSPPLNQEETTSHTLITSTSLSPITHTFTCTASNHLGKQSKIFTVKINPIVDYLPLIAGIVAISVVFIAVFFVFIYSIYYKNTKMGQYDLKLGKSRAQNANVAQNGRESSLPMKKLTQPSLNV